MNVQAPLGVAVQATRRVRRVIRASQRGGMAYGGHLGAAFGQPIMTTKRWRKRWKKQ